jgi:peptidoglycan/LPS O-acetylase OafA/YrhL
VAITFVMLQHSYVNLLWDTPWLLHVTTRYPLWCGVDLFFVISGYLIAGGLLRNFAAQPTRAALGRFWLRRAFRLWPAAWFWLALMLLGSAVLTNPPIYNTLPINIQSTLAGVFAYANIRFGTSNPFQDPYGPSYPYWSLSLEEQFYAALPLVMLICGRFLPWVMALAIIGQFPLAHSRLYMFLRTDALLWGVLLACWARHPSFTRFRPAWLKRIPLLGLAILGAVMVGMASISPILDSTPPYTIGIIAAGAAFLVWLAVQDRNLFHTGPLQPIVLWIGSRSYVLYLAHVPVFILACQLSRLAGPGSLLGANTDLRSAAIGIPLLIAATEFTHRCVENPLRELGAKIAERTKEKAVLF